METYTCEICAKVFSERLRLRNHFLIHKTKMNKDKTQMSSSGQSFMNKDTPSHKQPKNDTRNYMYSYEKTLELAHKIANEDLKSLGQKSTIKLPLPNALTMPLHFAPAKMKYTIPKKRPIQDNVRKSMDLNKNQGHNSSQSSLENNAHNEASPSKQRKIGISTSSNSINITKTPAISNCLESQHTPLCDSKKTYSHRKIGICTSSNSINITETSAISNCSESQHSESQHTPLSASKKTYSRRFGHPKTKQVRPQVRISRFQSNEECHAFISTLETGDDLSLLNEKPRHIYKDNSSSPKSNVSTLSTNSRSTLVKPNSDKPQEDKNNQNGSTSTLINTKQNSDTSKDLPVEVSVTNQGTGITRKATSQIGIANENNVPQKIPVKSPVKLSAKHQITEISTNVTQIGIASENILEQGPVKKSIEVSAKSQGTKILSYSTQIGITIENNVQQKVQRNKLEGPLNKLKGLVNQKTARKTTSQIGIVNENNVPQKISVKSTKEVSAKHRITELSTNVTQIGIASENILEQGPVKKSIDVSAKNQGTKILSYATQIGITIENNVQQKVERNKMEGPINKLKGIVNKLKEESMNPKTKLKTGPVNKTKEVAADEVEGISVIDKPNEEQGKDKADELSNKNKAIDISAIATKVTIDIANKTTPQSDNNIDQAISTTITKLTSNSNIQPCTSNSTPAGNQTIRSPNQSITGTNTLTNSIIPVANLENNLDDVSKKCYEKILPLNLEISNENCITQTFPTECDICKAILQNSSILNSHKLTHFQNKLTNRLTDAIALEQNPIVSNNGTPRRGRPRKMPRSLLLQNYLKAPKESAETNESIITDIPMSNNDYEELANNPPAPVIQASDETTPVLNLTQSIPDNRENADLNPFKCCLCSRTFKKQCYLGTHMTFMHNASSRKPKKKFICNICFKPFSSVMSLNDHQNLVHGEQGEQAGKFKCGLCPRSFSRNCSLVSHLNVHQIVNRELENKESPTEKNCNTVQFTCRLCRMKFNSRAKLSEHDKAFHRVKNYQGRKINIFKCTTCNKYFSRKEKYLIHKRNPCHLESYSNITDPAYIASVLLRRRRLKMKREKPNKCLQCGKRFRTPEQLSRHGLVHTGQLNKYYKCRHCGQFYDDLLELKEHKLLHKNNTKYKTTFANSTHFKQEVPFKNCEETCADGGSMFSNEDGFKFTIKEEPLSDNESKDDFSYPDFKTYNTYLESVLPKFDNFKMEQNENEDSDEEVFRYWVIPFRNFDLIRFTKKRKPVSYYKGKGRLPRLSDVKVNVLKISSKSNGSIECKVPASTLKDIFPKDVVIKVEDIKYII